MDRLKKPKDFLEKLRLTDSDYQDSGMINHIADLLERYNAEHLILQGVSERLNSIDFALHLEALTPLNRISVHPSPRTLGVDEIYDKYKRQQERNAR